METIPVQISEKICLTFMPNPSKNPTIKLTHAVMIFLQKSITFCRAAWICEKNPEKSPRKSAVNACTILVTKSITFLIAEITGAAAEIMPFTIDPIYVSKNSNTGCRALSKFENACFTCSISGLTLTHISEKACLTFAIALSTFSRNSSFVL